MKTKSPLPWFGSDAKKGGALDYVDDDPVAGLDLSFTRINLDGILTAGVQPEQIMEQIFGEDHGFCFSVIQIEDEGEQPF